MTAATTARIRPLLRRSKITAQHGVAVGQHLDVREPFAQGADMPCGHRHSRQPTAYWVWLENCTVLMGHTSIPRRRMGNTAALLPAQPNTTWDWIERMRFIDITAEKSQGKAQYIG